MEQQSTGNEGMLEVGDGHTIYWCSRGPRDAPAIAVLHGGPGGAMNLKWGEFFDASACRLVFFDQRGCGKSTPFGKLEHNCLAKLVADLEKLRIHLGIGRWALFGGSWGTTLALAYGAAFPASCSGFLLRGIFLARADDIDWFLWGVRRIFPDAHRRFLDAIEHAAGARPHDARGILALSAGPLARFDERGVALARAWTQYEMTLSFVNPPAAAEPPDEAARQAAVSMALLECHYMTDELPPAPLLPFVARIAHLPCHIVHGRFDMVCPLEQAHLLSQAWPGAHLSIVEGAGHATFEPGIEAALQRAAKGLLRDLAGPAAELI